MKYIGNMEENVLYKEVVVIGNGPSGITVSMMLSGRVPYFTTSDHPDDMLSARLKSLSSACLFTQDLEFLSQGLEGRSTNPVSLLIDTLLHPCADLGLDLEPLLEFRKNGKAIDHVVLGQGPPGGTWHRIDPDVLTLSLGSWMSLPEIPFPTCTTNEKRAFARDVATYYQNYVDQMELNRYFKNNTLVTSVVPINSTSNISQSISEDSLVKKKNLWVKKLDRDLIERVKIYTEPVNEMNESACFITNALNCLLSRNIRRNRLCKRPRNVFQENAARKLMQNKSEPIIIPKHERKRSISCCCCCNDAETINRIPRTFNHSQSFDGHTKHVPSFNRINSLDSDLSTYKWIIKNTDLETGEVTTYKAKYVVLACGAHDLPNRLEIFKERDDPEWLVHDLRSLENKLDEKLDNGEPLDPVVIVGAGLSAADGVMAVRSRNIPVIHIFRGKTAEFDKHLPENMYPEYHKVHQMMNDGGSTYPLYKAFPEHSLSDVDAQSGTIKLTSKTGEEFKIKVSFAAVLIGARPNLSFLPKHLNLSIFSDRAVDAKTNPVNVNTYTHEVVGHEGLFAVGPLAGDHFVRFIPGGAVATVAELYRRWNLV